MGSRKRRDSPDPDILDVISDMVMTGFLHTCTFSIMFGLFLVLFGQLPLVSRMLITPSHSKRKKATKAQHRMFAICVISFLLFMGHVSLQIGCAGSFLYSTFVADRNKPLRGRVTSVILSLEKMDVINYWLRAIELFFINTAGIFVFLFSQAAIAHLSVTPTPQFS
ncbi:hypothetical protein BDZ94DRAFT_1240885 [Collybia nuda]|uniref:Uncharacterized protein n=1 Tax=Collybia nuda TaxID=64659 RepID=A0A9P5XT75_9AGAR|nr:hypothetical protein BDZ94DRAFT_1240885 [Collybia nuda]